MKKMFKGINILLSILLVLIALGVAFIAFPQFGNKALIVRSGSMSPAIDVGSIVVARPADNAVYKIGDIIAFRSEKNPETLITHRVVSVGKDKAGVFYKTKGDANEEADGWSVSSKNVLGKVEFTLPYAGRVLTFAKSELGFLFLIAIPASFVIVMEIWTIFKEIRKRKRSSIQFGFKQSDVLKKSKQNWIGFKVLIPVIVMGFAIPGAYAFLNDTETSTNNIFQAASVFPTPTPVPCSTTVSSGNVVINEIMWMGMQGNASDEWIELRNMTSNPIDISNWVVEKLGTGAGPSGTIAIPSPNCIAAGGFFLISNDPKSTSIINIDPDVVDASVSLQNPGEQLILRVS